MLGYVRPVEGFMVELCTLQAVESRQSSNERLHDGKVVLATIWRQRSGTVERTGLPPPPYLLDPTFFPERTWGAGVGSVLTAANSSANALRTAAPALTAHRLPSIELGREGKLLLRKTTSPLGGDVRIVGVCLLRNEEYFAAWALTNIAAFCDRIIVMDNRSEDRTRRIVEAVAKVHPHVEILDVRNPRRTHKHLESLAGTATWVFGVDGDEIYDPAALAVLRRRLLGGAYADYWQIKGHVVHALGVDCGEGRAFGYAPSQTKGSMTKLYNFGIIDSWRSNNERLHGLKIAFRSGYSDTIFDFRDHDAWEESAFRCLHLCFMPRSSLDEPGNLAAGALGRKSPAEIGMRWDRLARRWIGRRLNPRRHGLMDYRSHKYAQGPVLDFDIAAFGAPSDFHAVDPDCGAAMTVLQAVTERREREGLDAAAA